MSGMAPDTIIVGSGISGLSAAIVLARHGRRVQVLESHVVPGGCMQMFQRRGPAGGKVRFDVGVHYVGSLKPGQTMWRLFRYLDVSVPTLPLDANCFDRISLPSGEFAVPVGWDALARNLRRACPGEAAAIAAFVARMRAVESSLTWHSLNADAPGAYDRTPHEETMAALLGELGVSPRLRSLLLAQSSLYGAPSARAPLSIHAAVIGSATEGPHYVVGGGDAITSRLVARLRELGGEVRTRAAVVRVLVEGDRAAGVELASGEVLRAPEVILALHPRRALNLMPSDAWRSVLRQRLALAPECVGLFCVYGVVQGELGEYAGRNHYLLRDDDPDCFYDPSTKGPADAIVNFAPPADGVQTFTAMSSARADWFAPWQATRTARRDAGYVALKQRLVANVMAMVEQRLPALRGRLTVVEASSPLTIRDYVSYPGGGLYGLEPSVDSQGVNGVRRKTRYHGLFVTGAGTGTPGVLGACVTGFAVAATALGNDNLIREVRRETDAFLPCAAPGPSP